MRYSQGGTKKWCPKCQAERVIKTLPPTMPDRRVNSTYYEDIWYYERAQECQTCSHYWFSAELPSGLMRELIGRRMDEEISLREKAAEAHAEESEYARLRLLSLLSGP